MLEKHKCNSIGIVGLGFKPNTPVVVESPSLKLAEDLAAKTNCTVNVYDALALDEARAELGDSVTYYRSLTECVDSSECCVIGTPDKGYADIPKHKGKDYPILDCWNIINHDTN